jgi:cell division septal protein FtsQ
VTVLASILASFVAGIAIYALLQPEFEIRNIIVEGEESVPKAAIFAFVAKNIEGTIGNVVPRGHILFYPRRTIEEGLRDAFPEFSAIRLRRDGLSAVRVSLISRIPYAMWCQRESGCFLVDSSGFAFAAAGPQEMAEYYRIDALSAATTSLKTVVIPPQKLQDLVSLAQRVEAIPLALSSIVLTENDEAVAVLSNGVRILLGAGGFTEALERLSRLLSGEGLVPRTSGGLGVSYIDLRYGKKIYFR